MSNALTAKKICIRCEATAQIVWLSTHFEMEQTGSGMRAKRPGYLTVSDRRGGFQAQFFQLISADPVQLAHQTD